MAKEVDITKKELKETKDLINKMDENLCKCAGLTNNFIEEEIAMDVRYVSETEGLKMIGNSGVPLSIVSEGWMKKYAKEMGVDTK